MPILPVPGGGGATVPQTYYNTPIQFGEYQFVSLNEIIDNFMASHVGEGKVLSSTLRGDVHFHAHRALQELHYDTLKSCKSLEIEVCPNLKVPLPHDYVNYVKMTYVDDNGIEHIIYPTRHTSNPFAIEQDDCASGNCGDTSETYTFGGRKSLAGRNPRSSNEGEAAYTTDPNQLKHQEEDCGTKNVTCEFDFSSVSGWIASNTGANQIYQYLDYGGAGHNLTDNEKSALWDTWFGLVDNYCFCLKNSDAEANCGEQLDWSAFDLVGSGRTNPQGEINNRAGWSGLRYPGIFTNVSRIQATNGTWNSFTTSVAISSTTSNAWSNYSGSSTNSVAVDTSTTTNLSVDTDNYYQNVGQRYGIDPQFAQANGSFYIDCLRGMIHFSSNLSGKTIIVHYLSDGHGTDDEAMVPKLAEEAMYKWIAYGCLSARADVPDYIVSRFKREKFAETRKAKIRISNIKIEEIAQIMRGKSKWIDH